MSLSTRDAVEYHTKQDCFRLMRLGVSREDAQSLRRISLTLRRWAELECGTGDGQVSVSIERDGDNGDGKPFRRVQYPTTHGYVDQRYPIADREAGAQRRLKVIMARYPGLVAYVQGDPRGCALYILTTDQIGSADVDSIYSRGVAVGL